MANEQSSTGTELPYTTATALDEDSREHTVTVETAEGTEADDPQFVRVVRTSVVYDEQSLIEGRFHPSDYTEKADCRIADVGSVALINHVLSVPATVIRRGGSQR